MSPSERRRLLNQAQKYARKSGSTAGGMAKHLGKMFGPFGKLIGMVSDVLTGGRKASRRDVEQAIETLENAGYQVGPQPPPLPGKRPPPLRRTPPPLPPPIQPGPHLEPPWIRSSRRGL